MELVKEIYLLTEKFPRAELFGLTSQMRRAVISIPSNIAEGFSRKYSKEFSQFIAIAFGSGAELETQLLAAQLLKFVSSEQCHKSNQLLLEIMKMLNKLRTNLTN